MEKKFITAGVVVYKGVKYLRMSNDTPEQRMRVLAKFVNQAQFLKMWSLPHEMTHEEAVDWLNANITELKVLSGEIVIRGQIPWGKEDLNIERCPAARAPKERKSRVHKAIEHKEVDNSPARYYYDCAPGKSLSFIEERAGAMGEAYIRLNGLESFTNEFVKSIFTKFASVGYVPTPFALVEEVVSKCPVTEDSIVGVIESMEWALYMRVCKDVRDVTFIVAGEASDREKKTAEAFGIKYIQLSEVERTGMKFDVVVGNPPYQGKAALHQQFFVKAFGTLNASGTIAFIQPATMYFNKKDNRRKGPETEMLATVNKHAISVTVKDESVFECADVGTKLAITVATTQKSVGSFEVTYLSGKKFHAESVDDVNQLEIDPLVFHSIRAKYKAMCIQNGSYERVVRSANACKAYIAKIRGNARGNDDFFTLVPRSSYRKADHKFSAPAAHDFGIPLKSVDHLENFYDYCETNFARMALALLKFNYHQESGELEFVPLMDFSRTYTDQELYTMAGFTQEEITVIESLLPDYYNRRK